MIELIITRSCEVFQRPADDSQENHGKDES